MPTLSLGGSVGRGGTNDRDDVHIVQDLLNLYLAAASEAQIRADGAVGPDTIAAIERFQREVVHFHNIDGRVDPDGRTFHALLVASGESQETPASSDTPPIAWGARVSRAFKQKIIAIAKGLGTKPEFLMSAIAFESGETFSPDIKNKVSGATGLIQFMPSTAARLGTTTEALAKMTAEDQLDFVEKYFRPYQGRVASIDDLYMSILWPAAIGKPLDYVLFKTPSQAYLQNRGLDADHDGAVTKQEAASPVAAKLNKGMKFAG